MTRSTIGWLWVAGQAILLGLLILVPGRDDWSVPGWASVIATVLFFGGLVLIGISALGLGSALTPTPVPTKSGDLSTTGLYGLVRHPIYTGVLAVVIAMAVRAESWVHLAIAVATAIFFDRKAAWEETQLHDRYPNYAEYAAVTPKFVPRLKR